MLQRHPLLLMMSQWRRGAAVVVRVLLVALVVAPLPEIVRRWGRGLGPRVSHPDGRHRVHGWYVMRSELGCRVAVVGVIRTAIRGRGRRAADAPWGLRVRDAVDEWRRHHVAIRRGLRRRMLRNTDRRRPKVVRRRQRGHGGRRRGRAAIDLAGWMQWRRAMAG